MRRPTAACFALTGCAFASMILPLPSRGAAPAAAGEGEAKQLTRVVSWLSKDAVYRGVHFVRIEGDGVSNRLFFRAADGARLVLADRLDARQGRLTWSLADDRSDWRVRLTADYGFRAETLQDFFAEYPEAEHESFGYRFQTEDGTVVEGVLGEDAAYDLPGALLHRLTDDGLAGPLAGGMPEEVRAAVLFLDRSLAQVGGAVRAGQTIEGDAHEPLLELLALVLRQEHRALRPPPLPMRLDELHEGHAGSPAVDALLTEFETVDRELPPSAPVPAIRPDRR